MSVPPTGVYWHVMSLMASCKVAGFGVVKFVSGWRGSGGTAVNAGAGA